MAIDRKIMAIIKGGPLPLETVYRISFSQGCSIMATIVVIGVKKEWNLTISFLFSAPVFVH